MAKKTNKPSSKPSSKPKVKPVVREHKISDNDNNKGTGPRTRK